MVILKKQHVEIEKLLEEGNTSQRQIALLTGVSRSAVKTVLRKMLLSAPDAGQNQESSRGMADTQPSDEIIIPGGAFQRCPHCGALVKMPCLACQLRRLGVQQRGRR